jgi:pimeloyl-ACP methyl ester carboxylesterase
MLRRKFPSAPLFAVGYSLGALLLTKYLSEADTGRWAQPPAPSLTPTPSGPRCDETDSVPGDSATIGRCSDSSDTTSTCPPGDHNGLPGSDASSAATPQELPAMQQFAASMGTGSWPSSAGSLLSGAVTISNPFCMSAASAKLDKPWTVPWLYNIALTFQCDLQLMLMVADITMLTCPPISRSPEAAPASPAVLQSFALQCGYVGAHVHRPRLCPGALVWLMSLWCLYVDELYCPMRRLRSYIHEHRHQVMLLRQLDAQKISAARTLRQFDTAATCIGAGFGTADEYYANGSSAKYIPRIRTPSLFVVSADDPLLGRLPIEECRANPCCVLAVTKVGGHCAHLQGLWPFGFSWAEDAAMHFIEALRPAEGSARPHATLQEEV